MKAYLIGGIISLAFFSTTLVAKKDENWAERLLVSSVIEVEASYTDSTDWGDGNSTSDIILATAELGLEFEIVENVSINLAALYKEGAVDFAIHEGFLQVDKIAGNDLSISLGKMYLPFGQFKKTLAAETLALELVSPDQSIGFRETAARFTTSIGAITVDGYIFNGDIDGEDKLGDWGLSFDYANDHFSFGVDYLNNVANSAMITEALWNIEGRTPYHSLSATSVNATITFATATLIFEYVQTDSLDVIGFTSTDTPAISQIELGYDLGNNWTVALSYQSTDEAFELGMPESRISTGFATTIYDDAIGVVVEYWHDGDYDVATGGTGEKVNGIVLQIVNEF